MDNDLKRSFKYSVFLHILPVLIFFLLSLVRGAGGTGKGRNDDPSKKNGMNKSTEVDITVIPKSNSLKQDGVSKNKCKTWYGGIGVMQNGFTNEIIEVYEGYSAYEAGIEVGDVLIPDESTLPIRGEVGSSIILSFYRFNRAINSYQKFRVKIKREKICTDENFEAKKAEK